MGGDEKIRMRNCRWGCNADEKMQMGNKNEDEKSSEALMGFNINYFIVKSKDCNKR